MSRIALSLAACAVLVSAASAQQPVARLDLDAERLDPQQVRLDFDYDGSSCELIEPAEIGEITNGIAAITIPTAAVSDTCTAQVVEMEGEQILQLDETVQQVEVTLLRPDGTVAATGTYRIERD
jgi:hypothetical protein